LNLAQNRNYVYILLATGYLNSTAIPSYSSSNFGSVIISRFNIWQIAGSFLNDLLSLLTAVSSDTIINFSDEFL